MPKLDTVEKRVEKILQVSVSSRSDDRLLLQSYMFIHHGISTFSEYARDHAIPSIESIRRCRQKIQARGDYPANGTVQVLRNASRKHYKNYAQAKP